MSLLFYVALSSFVAGTSSAVMKGTQQSVQTIPVISTPFGTINVSNYMYFHFERLVRLAIGMLL